MTSLQEIARFRQRFGQSRFGMAAESLHVAGTRLEEAVRLGASPITLTGFKRLISAKFAAQARLNVARDLMGTIDREIAEIKQRGEKSRAAQVNFKKLIGEEKKEATLEALEQNLAHLRRFREDVEDLELDLQPFEKGLRKKFFPQSAFQTK